MTKYDRKQLGSDRKRRFIAELKKVNFQRVPANQSPWHKNTRVERGQKDEFVLSKTY